MSAPLPKPGELIANVSGILSFYLTDSVVVVSVCTVHGDDETVADPAGRQILGSVLRDDFDGVLGFDTFVAKLNPPYPITALCVVIVTDDPDGEAVAWAQETLFCSTNADDAPLLQAYWHVP